jgi:hypothetical protein
VYEITNMPGHFAEGDVLEAAGAGGVARLDSSPNQTRSARLKAKRASWPQVVSRLADIRKKIFLEDQKL